MSLLIISTLYRKYSVLIKNKRKEMKRMANETKENKSTQLATKEKKPKVTKVTVSQTVRDLGKVASKNRIELAKKVVANLKGRGIIKNIKNMPITEEKVVAEIGAIMRDISSQKKGWWSTYTFEEDDNKLRIFYNL
jgi:hypothetical protein